MSFQNKRVRIMSRPTVLRRILSNGDDRQADRLAQTLPVRRPGERPGHFLSLSDPPPLHSSRHPLLLHHLFYFRPKHPPVLFCLNNSPTPLSTLCKHRWRLIFVPPPLHPCPFLCEFAAWRVYMYVSFRAVEPFPCLKRHLV